MAGGKLLEISGKDAEHFLQNLVTNDLSGLDKGLVYAAILTPQGKYLADFFLMRRGETILLDVAPSMTEGLARRLTMYRLRADVQITASDLTVTQLGREIDGALPDPRHPALGYRLYTDGALPAEAEAARLSPESFTALRVAHVIPESGIELIADDSYILEHGFARLNGVDFRKGCYVGQEVTARMKHKTELRKGLVQVAISGEAPIGSEILIEGKSAGTLFSQAGGKALAHLRFDRAEGAEMTAADAKMTWDGQQPG